jgi:hypothetical protein
MQHFLGITLHLKNVTIITFAIIDIPHATQAL